ncbi:hypothetical protein [Mucisphaera calidilacus]|uniref:Uncharacterized protein n=1 Tax=Mucisphaera calidilacus TaxID=2527982 RepID=A0A518BVC2_9BACT|nr:hypothetical protein [Mucisphaera calidilacus]QDU70897.1 hypothetical protein Pan265_07390 [Mucisphaera calidilacus]
MMNKITIPIPDDLAEDQVRELEGYLSDQVRAITGEFEGVAITATAREEIARRIRAGLEALRAGEVFTSAEARARLEKKLRG